MTSSPYITLTMLVKLYIFKPREWASFISNACN